MRKRTDEEGHLYSHTYKTFSCSDPPQCSCVVNDLSYEEIKIYCFHRNIQHTPQTNSADGTHSSILTNEEALHILKDEVHI